MAVAAAALTFGLGPVASHAHEFAEWVVQSLVPWLVVLAVSLYISLLRATLRCPVRVYVGNDPKIRRVVTRCPSFQKDYRPPAWAAGAWAQAVLYLYRSWRNQHLKGLIREQVELPDGEYVHLMWMLPPCCRVEPSAASEGDGNLSEYDAPAVPDHVPIVVICHGVFQSAADLYEFCEFLTNTCGYLACVFSRRGNDSPLSRPKFNTVGDQQDFRFILSRIRNRFPAHRMYGVGISAGSSLLARYLGDAGEEAELDGGVLVSPGYDMEKSLRHMTPLADMVITLHAKSFFLTQNYDTLASENKNVLKKLYRSRSMHEFHQNLHFFDGKASSEEYFNTHNPSRVLDQIRKPSVYINAYDDMCFPGDFTFQYKNLVDRCQHATVLHMELGGHGTFYEGWDAGTSRFFTVVREFVDCLQEEAGMSQGALGGEREVVMVGEAADSLYRDVGATGAAVALSLSSTTRTLTSVLGGLGEEDIRVVETLTEQRDELCAVVQQQQQTDSSDSSDSEDDLPPGLCTLTADSTTSTSSSVTSTSSAGTRREEESQLETGRSAKSVVFVHKVVVSAAAGVQDPLVQVLAQ